MATTVSVLGQSYAVEDGVTLRNGDFAVLNADGELTLPVVATGLRLIGEVDTLHGADVTGTADSTVTARVQFPLYGDTFQAPSTGTAPKPGQPVYLSGRYSVTADAAGASRVGTCVGIAHNGEIKFKPTGF